MSLETKLLEEQVEAADALEGLGLQLLEASRGLRDRTACGETAALARMTALKSTEDWLAALGALSRCKQIRVQMARERAHAEQRAADFTNRLDRRQLALNDP